MPFFAPTYFPPAYFAPGLVGNSPGPNAGFSTGYATAFATGYHPGSGGQAPVRHIYAPPSPTGWKSAGRRAGVDPRSSRGTRLAGRGEG